MLLGFLMMTDVIRYDPVYNKPTDICYFCSAYIQSRVSRKHYKRATKPTTEQYTVCKTMLEASFCTNLLLN